MEPVAPFSVEPSPARPRRVEKRAGFAGIGQAFFALLIPHFWIGLLLIAGAIGQLAFPLVARDVDATVVERREQKTKNGLLHEVRVEVRVGDRLEREWLPSNAREAMEPTTGRVMAVRVARIAGVTMIRRADRVAFPVLLPVALFWNGVVGVFVYQLAVLPLLRWWLARRGAVARGVVLQTKSTNRGGSITVQYRFGVGGSAPHSAIATRDASMTVTKREFERSTLPPEITVYYHPRWPWVSTIDELGAWAVRDA